MQAAQTSPLRSGSPSIPPVTRNEPMSRNDLLLLATSRFCESESHNRLSLDQYREAFYLLISAVNAGTKQRVAQLVANYEYTPRPIILYLALEALEISSSILSTSKLLGQLDLLRIVEMKGKNHAAIIASRHDIGPSLIHRLKKFEATEVDEALQSNYAINSAAPMRELNEVFSEITQNTTPASSPSPSSTTNAEQALLNAASRGGRIQSASQPTQPTSLAIVDFGAAFERAAQTRSHQAMVVLMQKQAGLHANTANQILADKSGDTLAVFLRSADVEDAQANRIQMLTQPTIGLSVQNATRAIRFYAQLKSDTCQLAVDQWPKVKAKGIEHQTYLEEGASPRQRTAESTVSSAHERLQKTG